ncbi:hypothetical protein AMJ52_03475 [candidate division TA06 bacterium DG_78]|uniref:Tetratricopeptide repeat-like domain-containing protein n=1 Tax=candidate division TA06 bacterium DG_78 TaxID=1703772 RepID=A0A0S7YFM8_UNCT6|nr:MAG: hypothetical protein AMJ52_03475 [candidate division TA06 bacterium DG_78]
MKKVILIIVGVVVVLFIVMAFFGYQLEKKEVEEITPEFERLYQEAIVLYRNNEEAGIEALEDVMYYGHTHSLASYKDALITGYSEYYREGLNLLAKHYRERGKMLEDEGRFLEALKEYEKIFNYTNKDQSIAYKKGVDVDLLFTEIKRLEKKIK